MGPWLRQVPPLEGPGPPLPGEAAHNEGSTHTLCLLRPRTAATAPASQHHPGHRATCSGRWLSLRPSCRPSSRLQVRPTRQWRGPLRDSLCLCVGHRGGWRGPGVFSELRPSKIEGRLNGGGAQLCVAVGGFTGAGREVRGSGFITPAQGMELSGDQSGEDGRKEAEGHPRQQLVGSENAIQARFRAATLIWFLRLLSCWLRRPVPVLPSPTETISLAVRQGHGCAPG